MAEFEIFPNRRVFVSIVGREIEEKVPLKPLILTPPAKIVNSCLPLGFHQQFFFVRVRDIICKLKNKKSASWNKMSIKLYIPQWTVDNVRTNNMVTLCQKSARHVFMLSTDQYIKNVPDAVQYCGICVL